MRLFEIHDAIERILSDPEKVDPETGEIGDAAIAELDALEMERDAKALAVARYLVGEKAEGEAVKAQADRLARRARAHANRAERLRRYLESYLPAGTKLRDDVVSIGWRRTESVFVPDAVDLAAWPEEFTRTTVEARRDALRQALKDEKPVPAGVALVARNGIQVR